MVHSMSKYPKGEAQDLTGKTYGRLTVLGPAEDVNGRTAWRCRCDCGRETVVTSVHLKDGSTKSCGCRDGTGGLRPGTSEPLLSKSMRAAAGPGSDGRAEKVRMVSKAFGDGGTI